MRVGTGSSLIKMHFEFVAAQERELLKVKMIAFHSSSAATSIKK